MRWRAAIVLLAALAMLLCGCAGAESGEVWMYACSVGKGDAILIGSGDAVCLVDAGYVQSRGKILAAMREMNVARLDAVILTHTDKDHAGGLEWLAESDIEVGAWYASAMFADVKEKKHPAVKAAARRGEEVVWLQTGDEVELGDALLRVLAPGVQSDSENDNSLVMMLESVAGRILLGGDMEFAEEAWLMGTDADLNCDVLKVPNHADDDTASDALIRAASPKVAVICTDSAEKPETPDARVLASLESVGAQTIVTQQCTGGVLVRLKNGETSAECVDLPQTQANVRIVSIVSGEDTVSLINDGAQKADLSGWYVFSDRGGEWFVLPDGTSLESGETLVIGTNSTQSAFDLLWDDKKVVHKSKTDTFSLYDANGLKVSTMTNGL